MDGAAELARLVKPARVHDTITKCIETFSFVVCLNKDTIIYSRYLTKYIIARTMLLFTINYINYDIIYKYFENLRYIETSYTTFNMYSLFVYV